MAEGSANSYNVKYMKFCKLNKFIPKTVMAALLLFSSHSFANEYLQYGRSTIIPENSVRGHSNIIKLSGYVDAKIAKCDVVVQEAIDLFGQSELQEFFVYDYAYGCIYGSFFVQLMLEPKTRNDIPAYLEYRKKLEGEYFYKQRIDFLELAMISGATTMVAKNYVARKKIDYRYDFTTAGNFEFTSFGDYFRFKGINRDHFRNDSKVDLMEYLQGKLEDVEAKLLPDVLDQSNYLEMNFPLHYVLSNGSRLDSFWTDGIFRYLIEEDLSRHQEKKFQEKRSFNRRIIH